MLVSFYLNRMRLIQQAYGTGKAHMCRMAAIETIGSILDGNELETSLLRAMRNLTWRQSSCRT